MLLDVVSQRAGVPWFRWVFSAIALILLLLNGCVIPVAPSATDREVALKLVDAGTLYLRRGELERAAGAFQAALEIHQIPAAVDGLGCVALLIGDYARAEQMFIKAYGMDEQYRNSLGNLALLYEVTGATDAASALHQRAVIENPSNFRFRNNFGVFVHDYRGMQAVARAELRKAQALAHDPVIERNIVRIIAE